MATHSSPKVIVGRVRFPSGYRRGAVHIADGRVVQVSEGEPSAQTTLEGGVVDVGDDFVLPGAIDAHVHCYSHDGEGMEAATRSAAAGGVTTIIEMPFDKAGPVNSRERLEVKKEIVDREAITDVALLGTLAPGGGWSQAATLAEGGVIGFKLSLFHTDAYRFPRIDDAELLDAFAAIADVNRTVCVHAENNEIVQKLSAVQAKANPYDPLTHVNTRPPVSETLGVLTAMELAHATGVRLHLCHMSLPRAIDLAEWFRAEGTDVSAETCPHYLTFTAEDMNVQHGRLKINPPLRTRADVDGLWQRLGEGKIGLVTSDHAPWPLSLKENREILKNSSGVPGVELLPAATLGGALLRDPNPEGLFDAAVNALTTGPASRYGFGDRKGRLEPGFDADVMVFRADPDYVITDESQHSNAGWTPYAGLRPGGLVTLALSRGEVIWDASTNTVAAPGRGLLVEVS